LKCFDCHKGLVENAINYAQSNQPTEQPNIRTTKMSVEILNANIMVTELLARSLENACKEVVLNCVRECGKAYNFNADEAMSRLGLEKLVLVRKPMAKKSAGPKKEKVPKSTNKAFPLPFISELVNENGCWGLSYNHGLFTQCTGSPLRAENGSYCKKCQTQADKNASGKPDCLSVSDRRDVGLYEFKDGKGRQPTPYPKTLAKMKLSMEDAVAEASKIGIELHESHMNMPEKKTKTPKTDAAEKKRGRPKKEVAQVNAENVDDLFAKLTTDAAEEVSDTETNVSSKKVKLTEEEKAAKKAELEAKRAEAKALKEAEKAAEKAAKEAEREAKKEAEKAEREAKRAAEKAEREAKKAAEKAEREAKKEALAEQKKAEKEALAAQKKAAKKTADKTADKTAETEQTKPLAEETKTAEKVKVSLITIDGVQYYKNKATNVLMDKTTHEEIGTYDAENKKIIPFPDDDELDVEESEDEYDEE
jgi:chemotaxis protein histidine kinase CheA